MQKYHLPFNHISLHPSLSPSIYLFLPLSLSPSSPPPHILAQEIYNTREIIKALNGQLAYVTSFILFVFLQNVLSCEQSNKLSPFNKHLYLSH